MQLFPINMEDENVKKYTLKKLEIYNALGCVDISVEPHFDHQNVTDELMQLSKEYIIYGLCDDSVIVCSDEKKEFYGEVYKLSNGTMEQLET